MIKDIWDLACHLAKRMEFETFEQNWDLFGTISGLWSRLGPSPKFGTSLRALEKGSDVTKSRLWFASKNLTPLAGKTYLVQKDT